ncbi:Cof-type HAD-IIB family hydrolase [Natroniella sulfidigena]|uniref:Cof-type HAD-IIB family hydrolase n=1 Tax=Natroniella sulfidigena TaxID=723921 RepID=UPI002009E41E|nr:Cof-type HAD-IIB family hydrolase [Natroniella sulfidigena]MCK8817205.1 Cof-type HAD-IIB family hydrolase [Natroniella sulfidigena]
MKLLMVEAEREVIGMDYKLVAIDLDDTLLADDLEISKRTVEAIEEAQKQGVRVVIATGRMHSSALPYAKLLGLENELITYNGALVKQLVDNQTLYHEPVSAELARQIAKVAQEYDLHINFYLDDLLYVNKAGAEADYYEEVAGIKPILITEDLVDFVDQPSTKILIIENDKAKLKEAFAELTAKFSDSLTITTSKANFIEIMSQEVYKGNTLANLATELGIEAEEVMAIGDSYNDLEMIEYAGLGVAVGNAKEEIKEEADYITGANDEEGVAQVIEKFIL